MTFGLILAAGAGSRFDGGFKLLADLDGRPLVERAIRGMCDVEAVQRIVVVLGARADEMRAAVDFGRAEPVICREWEAGMSASLQAGVTALGPDAERVIVALGDAPTVTPGVIGRLLAATAPARATYDGQPGHPVVLARAQLAEVPSLTGDQGARTLLAGAALIECGDLASGIDVDTATDLAGLRGAGNRPGISASDRRRVPPAPAGPTGLPG